MKKQEANTRLPLPKLNFLFYCLQLYCSSHLLILLTFRHQTIISLQCHGSVFLLLANLPIPGYAEFMAGIFGKDWTIPLNAVAGGTFSVLAVIAVLAITYKYVEAEGCDAIMASILALSTFIIILPPFAANRTVPSSTTSSRRPGLAATASSRPSSSASSPRGSAAIAKRTTSASRCRKPCRAASSAPSKR